MKAKHFKIHELVPPVIYQQRGEKAWELIDVNLIKLIDALREEFGQATINDYLYGGSRMWSGLRTADSPDYSVTSQHSFGRAVDMKFKNVSAEAVRQAMLKDPSKWVAIYPYISLEHLKDGKPISWLHIDVRNNSEPGIRLFNV